LNEIKTVQQTKEAIDKVTIEDVYNVANKIFVDEKLNLVLIGDRKEKLKNFKF
jgi:predicted Zn-dependent peptidase